LKETARWAAVRPGCSSIAGAESAPAGQPLRGGPTTGSKIFGVRWKESVPARHYTAEKTETPNVEPDAPQPETQRTNGPANDLGLLQKAAAGDGRAFHALLDPHMDRLYRLAVSLIGNAADAEDVLQETFAGAYRGLSKFEGRASVGTWLTRILVLQTARFRRDRRRKPMGALGSESEGPADGKPSGLGGVDARIDIQAALLQLSPAHREVLVLREFEQMSYEEIADVVGVPQGTVESRLHRARVELREKLAAYLP
jgi:RNA polymerase sigma-70 factor (ECF subfamily)